MISSGVEVKKLFKQYGKRTVLHDLNFKLESGITGLLGPNGAGKTTLMKILSGVPIKYDGEIVADDFDYLDKKSLRANVGYMPQNFNMYSVFTLYQNLEYLALLSNVDDSITRKSRVEYLLSKLGLYEHRNKKFNSLSGGMKRRFGIAQAMLHDPEILILDEPTVGIDPHERQKIRKYISDLSKEKIILYSTHIIEDIQHTCEEIIILNYGKQIYSGGIDALLNRVENKVYETICMEKEYEKTINLLKSNNALVVSEMNTKKGIKLRIICEEPVGLSLYSVVATLEDAYFFVMGEDDNV